MLISLHKQATMTPKVRAAIQRGVLADRYAIYYKQTVWSDSVHDRSHTPH